MQHTSEWLPNLWHYHFFGDNSWVIDVFRVSSSKMLPLPSSSAMYIDLCSAISLSVFLMRDKSLCCKQFNVMHVVCIIQDITLWWAETAQDWRPERDLNGRMMIVTSAIDFHFSPHYEGQWPYFSTSFGVCIYCTILITCEYYVIINHSMYKWTPCVLGSTFSCPHLKLILHIRLYWCFFQSMLPTILIGIFFYNSSRLLK